MAGNSILKMSVFSKFEIHAGFQAVEARCPSHQHVGIQHVTLVWNVKAPALLARRRRFQKPATADATSTVLAVAELLPRGCIVIGGRVVASRAMTNKHRSIWFSCSKVNHVIV